MGVPKFFRYISERYPCLSEFVQEYQIPVYDNLYLDMNGIIHMCSHPDDNNPHFRISEEKLFLDIFHYIEFLFRMIKPRKVFFLAVDGVAPRAKMNQQRGRRFRSAKDAEKAIHEAMKKGEKLPDEARFDSNCITPGTVFMERLHQQLKYFIVNKISTEKLWRKCKVILSGHETPGEGEHKIMDYIRYIRSQPGYDPNTRHCLYGLDADLIMLGLCTHEPHFSLLREEVNFGKKTTSKRSSVPEEIRFYLLHLSLMREYLELEFAPLKDKLIGFEFNIENIIDDWVLMGFLVGNDFIPHLPNLHITNGALPVLYKAYMDVLPTLDGYINEGGTLNLKRFEKFMQKLSNIDLENFEEIREDIAYMESKTGRKYIAHFPVNSKGKDKVKNSDYIEETDDSGLSELIKNTEDMFLDLSAEEDEDDTDEDDEENSAFKDYKDNYYRNKLEYENVTEEVMKDQAEGYVRAIQWNLNYYYNGVCSWSWFYPHHYAPYISDIKDFHDLTIKFELGKPFKPFEQLLAVLPSASKSLLPTCYHSLMTDSDSKIKDYYPDDFQTDLNGKKQEWEAVVLIPFIDEVRLLEAMKPCNDELSHDEVKRNTHGPMLVYQYVEDDLGEYEAPQYFQTISVNHASCTKLTIDDLRVPTEKLIKGAYPGFKFDVYYPGFPTMKYLKYEAVLSKAKLKLFDHPSKNESMIIKILSEEKRIEDINVEDYLGKIVFVGWPHLVEAKIIGVSDENKKYSYTEEGQLEIKDKNKSLFYVQVEGLTDLHLNRKGIDFGKINILLHVNEMVGRRYIYTANGRINLEKQFNHIESQFPLQGIVKDVTVYDEHHCVFRDINDIFPVGCDVFVVANPHYGSMGTILDSTDSIKNGRLKVCLKVMEEPDLSEIKLMNEKLKKKYLTLFNCASQLAISNYLFSRITGSLFITTNNNDGELKTVNIGLDLKFNKKNLETPNYTKKISNSWHYSNNAVDLVRAYAERYREIFDYLSQNIDADELNGHEIYGEDVCEKVKDIQLWLKSLPTYNIERQVCHSSILDRQIIDAIEEAVDKNVLEITKTLTLQLKPQLLYKPEILIGNIPPDPYAITHVFDRIVNVREGISVPLGLKGTVIAIHKPSTTIGNEEEIYDIIFDRKFNGGLTLNCSENRGYRLTKVSFINLSYGVRLMEQKTGKPGELLAFAKAKQNTANMKNIVKNYPTQENSAFASFNNNPNNMRHPVPYNYYNQPLSYGLQRRTGTIEIRPQNPLVPAHQLQLSIPYGAMKLNDFMPDFIASSKSDQTVVNGRVSEFIKRHVEQPQNQQQKNESTSVVNTDFLKKILKISSSTKNNDGNKHQNDNVNKDLTEKASTSKFQSQQQQQPLQKQLKQKVQQIQPSLNQSAILATTKLLNYYQMNGLGCPRYSYFESRPGYTFAQLKLPNGKLLKGNEAQNREQASENVAVKALNIMHVFNEVSKDSLTAIQEIKCLPVPPIPPKKWVQNNKNSSDQSNSGQQKSKQTNNLKKNDLSKAKLKNNVSGYTNNFIPLQAIKHAVINKNVLSKNIENGSEKNQKEKDVQQQQQQTNQQDQEEQTNVSIKTTNSNNNLNKKLENNDQSKNNRRRRTRIAANFINKT